MARLEDEKTLTIALRHIVRLLHPGGEKVCFNVPEMVDRMQLSCRSLPVERGELRSLVGRAFGRRGLVLDMESLYRDFVKSNGRLTMDPSRPYPECQGWSRHP